MIFGFVSHFDIRISDLEVFFCKLRDVPDYAKLLVEHYISTIRFQICRKNKGL